MQNATQIFTLPHGLSPLELFIEIEYEQEQLHALSMENIGAKQADMEQNSKNFNQKSFQKSQAPQNAQGSQNFQNLQNPQDSGKLDPKITYDSFAKNVFIQLGEYFMGQRTSFDIPLKPEGTPFQLRVWEALTQIPYGQTCSYKDIACSIHNEKACRAVGMANNKNPLGIIVPCHRVIGANGKLVGYAGGLSIKSALLDLEKHTALSTL